MLDDQVTSLSAGTRLLFGGNRWASVPDDVAAAFVAGDEVLVVDVSGAVLHIAVAARQVAHQAVTRAHEAFGQLASVDDEAISEFFVQFAQRLESDDAMTVVLAANRDDVARAQAAGRSTTRLELSAAMRADMAAGLRAWAASPLRRDDSVRHVDHDGWSVELRRAPLGVVAFVFEGRPNVFADACGVVRTGNTVVFRIGSDALATARAIVTHALRPALAAAGLPEGTVTLVDSAARSAGYALFSEPRVALAVARGSGLAVEQLGAVARQSGINVSLHGTGGGWMVVGEHASRSRLLSCLTYSLDRKVCNTTNVVTVIRSRADDCIPVVLEALSVAATRRGTAPKLHVDAAALAYIAPSWRDAQVLIARAVGEVMEAQVEVIERDDLGHEWEWEGSPEISLVVVESLDEAIALANRYSPRLVASCISDEAAEQDAFYAGVDMPFVGDGFTRWVDGQFALLAPELGLSNWEGGRLLGRSGVLSGDSVFTIRARVRQSNPDLHR
jgi:glutamate-5-semialdehyde dehydrogenase